jgi:ribosomal protein S18 acetylase RimI-like enzyme
MEFLERMHRERPSIVATDGDTVVGYALATVKAIRDEHELLRDLFDTIDKTSYKDHALKSSGYVVVGQLCVSKNYRGLGLVKQMYQHFRETYSPEFDYCITDVAEDNPRSLKAHLKSGFAIIAELQFEGVPFNLVLWDWNSG